MKNRIKEMATSCGISLAEVAKVLGMKPGSLSEVVSGRSNLPLKKSRKLCELFECTLDELYPIDVEGNPGEIIKQWGMVPLFVSGDDEMIFLSNEGEIISYFKKQLGDNPGFKTTVEKINQIIRKIRSWSLQERILLSHAIIGSFAPRVVSDPEKLA